MQVLDKPKETLHVHGAAVLRFSDESNYSDPFGYEWKEYQRTYTDSTLGQNVSRSRLELNLGFPLEFLDGMNVLELGCGQGRFTEHLVKYAKHVVAVDLSEAVYHNIALEADNITAIRADLQSVPKLSEPIDLVFCRGVLQHTDDPIKSMHALFDTVRPDGLVIFDVYKRGRGRFGSFKYFWRPIVQRAFSIERFDGFLNRHEKFLYKQHHLNLKAFSYIQPVANLLSRTPFYLARDWDADYPNLTEEQRIEIAKNEMIDMLYSGYDQPMTPEEVIDALALIGQKPYSFDYYRNQYRCKFSGKKDAIKVQSTKSGILEID